MRAAWAAASPGSTPARTTACWRPAKFIRAIEQRQGLKIACPEEIAAAAGFIAAAQCAALGQALGKTDYGRYLIEVAREAR